MKRIVILISMPLLLNSCSKASSGNGKVTGTITDTRRNPLENVSVIIDHSILFNANISTKTGSNGKYSVSVPTGSWYAFAQHKVNYNGRTYTIYLHPDNSSGFGAEGAVRNFTWYLTGKKETPLSGTYGALITFDNFPGVFLENESEIVFRMIPDGKLIDGSVGDTLNLRAADGYQLPEVPIGKYRVTASYQGRELKLRKWNTDDPFLAELIVDIEPRIDGQCDNCAKLEYRE